MAFYSRFVCICNICFILAVILRAVEMAKRSAGNFNGAIPFQPLESTIVILGYGAIILNAIFVLSCLFFLVAKKPLVVSRWIIWFNFVIFPVQVYFHFFSQ